MHCNCIQEYKTSSELWKKKVSDNYSKVWVCVAFITKSAMGERSQDTGSTANNASCHRSVSVTDSPLGSYTDVCNILEGMFFKWQTGKWQRLSFSCRGCVCFKTFLSLFFFFFSCSFKMSYNHLYNQSNRLRFHGNILKPQCQVRARQMGTKDGHPWNLSIGLFYVSQKSAAVCSHTPMGYQACANLQPPWHTYRCAASHFFNTNTRCSYLSSSFH